MCTVSTIYACSIESYFIFFLRIFLPFLLKRAKQYESHNAIHIKRIWKMWNFIEKKIIIRIWSGESICFGEKVISMWKVDKKNIRFPDADGGCSCCQVKCAGISLMWCIRLQFLAIFLCSREFVLFFWSIVSI